MSFVKLPTIRKNQLGWISLGSLLFMIAAPHGVAVSRKPAPKNLVSATLHASTGTTSASAEVSLCSDSVCSSTKTLPCPSLDAPSGSTSNEPCTQGGGWKGYSYDITVIRTDGSTFECSGTNAVGTAFTCNDPNGTTDVFADVEVD